MSEAAEQSAVTDPLLEQALEAIDDPAVVCDLDGRVRGWNERFAARTGEEGCSAGVPVERLVDCGGDRPVDRAAAEGSETAATGVIRGDPDRPCTATCRPLCDGDAVAGVLAVATVHERPEETWPVYEAGIEAVADLLYVVDGDHTIWTVDDVIGAVDGDGAVGRDLAWFRERDLVDDATLAEVRAAVDRVLRGESERATVTGPMALDGDERFLEHCVAPIEDDGHVVGAIGVARDVDERERRRHEIGAVVENSPDPIAVTDTEGRYRIVNEASADAMGRPREQILGRTPTEAFGEDPGAAFESHAREALESETVRTVEERVAVDGVERYFRTTRAPFYGSDGDVRGTISVRHEVTEERRQREELERLTGIQHLVQESIAALAAATTEDGIKRAVCERLADSPFYEFAWVGERDPSTNEITPVCSAGEGDGYLSAVTVTTGTEAEGQGPGGCAYRSGDVSVVRDVREDPSFEPWREAALDRGFESVLSVPLTRGATVHGKLGVYAGRPDAFSDREVDGFEVLGEVVGFALSAARSRRLLESEAGTELEFRTRDEGLAFAPVSAECDCRFVFDHPVRTDDGRTRCYLTVEGADPSVGRTVANRSDTVESCRALDAGDDGPQFELVVSESVYDAFAEAGVRGERIVVEDGIGTIVVEGPGDVDVRTVYETLASRFPDVDLVARREQEAGDASRTGTPIDVEDRLTDRQRAVLRSAYYSGYYEWPRETDAETLAESFDIASTTLLQHLRKGHGEVMAALFDG